MATNMETIWEETDSDVELEEFEYLEYWEDRDENDYAAVEKIEIKKWKGIFCLNREELHKMDEAKDEVEDAEETDGNKDNEEVELEDPMNIIKWVEMVDLNLEKLLEDEQEEEEQEDEEEDLYEEEEEVEVAEDKIQKKKWWKRLGNLLFCCARKKKNNF